MEEALRYVGGLCKAFKLQKSRSIFDNPGFYQADQQAAAQLRFVRSCCCRSQLAQACSLHAMGKQVICEFTNKHEASIRIPDYTVLGGIGIPRSVMVPLPVAVVVPMLLTAWVVTVGAL